jgi:hypothetical protein
MAGKMSETGTEAVEAPEKPAKAPVNTPYMIEPEAVVTLTLLWEGKRLTLPWQNLELIHWSNDDKTLTGEFGKHRFVAKLGKASAETHSAVNFGELYSGLERCAVQRLYNRPTEGFTLSVQEQVPGGEGEPPSWEPM